MRRRARRAGGADHDTLKRWLRRWVAVRYRDAAERTVLTAIDGGASPAALADLLFAAETDRAFAAAARLVARHLLLDALLELVL
jgi:hypothetical protein